MANRPRRRPRRLHASVFRSIQEMYLADQHISAAEIRRRIEVDVDLADQPVPHVRTIQKHLREMQPTGPTKWWSSIDAEADEAALILPVVGELIRRELADTISTGLARWVVHVRTIAPEMPLYPAFQMASRYDMAEHTQASAKQLDAYMALELWRAPFIERGAISAGLIPSNWWYVGPSAPKEELP